MTEKTTDYVAKTTPNVVEDQVEQLKHIFPECVTEGKVDFDRLRATLGDLDALSGEESYTFTWAGKQEAFRAIQTPSAASLAPAPDESVNWDTTQHLFIEGENLEVLKLLYKSYFGRVKMIYIDPPYNTGNDFIYQDDYSQPRRAYLEKTGQMDAEGNLLRTNAEASGRFHSDWLSMMYPRLFLARQLLREDGVIFISIDDNEVHNLRLLMNEVFGEENFVDCVVWQKRVSPANDARWFSSDHDYLLVYAKSKEIWRPNRLPRSEKQRNYYKNPDNDPRGPWNSVTYTCNKSKNERPHLYYPIVNPNTGSEIWPKETAVWKYNQETYQRHIEEDVLYWGVDGKATMPRAKRFLSDVGKVVPRSIWLYSDVGHTQEATQEFAEFFPDGNFDSPKPTRLVRRILQVGTDAQNDDVVVDFFSGSCTTAQAVLKLNREDGGNRRFIMVQIPELTEYPDYPTIANIGKERIRRAIARMKAEREGQLPLETRETAEDLGFKVFKLAPSTFHQWESPKAENAEALEQQLSFFDRGLEEGADPQHVIYEVILKLGYSLNARIVPLDLETNRVYRVVDEEPKMPAGEEERSASGPPYFYVCLDDQVHQTTLDVLHLDKETTFICLDTALDDSQKVNLALQCLLKVV